MQDDRKGLPSASGIPRIVYCPGSRSLEPQAPPEIPSDEAQEGDAIHKALEKESDAELDESGKNIAQRLRSMEAQAVSDWLAELGVECAAPIPQRETRLWIRDRKTLTPVASSKLDVFYVIGTKALAIDSKTGYLAVPPARTNIQMRVQALALWHEYDFLTSIRVATAQFRFFGRFTASDYGLEDLKRAEQELIFNLWRSEQPDAPRVPSEESCRYCRARSFCPEAAAFALLPVVPMPSRDLAKKDIPAAVATLDLPTLGFLRHKAAMIENILEAVGKRLKTQFTAEELATVGLKLQPSVGVRTLPDVQALWTALHNQNVSEGELRSILKASYGAAQELMVAKLKAANPALTDKDAQAQADKILEPAVKLAAREPSLKSL